MPEEAQETKDKSRLRRVLRRYAEELSEEIASASSLIASASSEKPSAPASPSITEAMAEHLEKLEKAAPGWLKTGYPGTEGVRY